jgi:DNA-binding IclR family transcriptional regulator
MAEAVERALRILVELGDGPATISDLARRLDVHRSTALRLLRPLEAERFVRRREDGRYALGATIQSLSQAALEEHDVRAVAHPHLQALGDRHGHTVHLAALQDREVVYLDKVESTHAIRMHSRIGATAPLHATGVGKAILAQLPEAQLDQLLGDEPYRSCTAHTRTTRTALETELAATRDRGWVLDDREHEEFIHCVAAPVFDATGRVCAAISITVPVMIMERDDLIALAPDVTSAAAAIGQDLGWKPRDDRQLEETP